MEKFNKYTLEEDYKCAKVHYKCGIMHMLKYIKCELQCTLKVFYNANVHVHQMCIGRYIQSIVQCTYKGGRNVLIQ